jgi:glycosyltransferase involved in cell wall biosynthesis
VPPRPTVTIGMPVRNVARYVEEAIESVRSQTFDDWELVISDNSSTDETPEICERFARDDPRIRLIRQRVNIGAEPNFNAVAAEARGIYFKWWGGDDLCEPPFLEHSVETLAGNDDAVLAYQHPIIIDENGNRLGDAPLAAPVDSPLASERLRALLENMHQSGGWLASIYSFCLMKTAALRRAGPIGTYFASDNVFIVRMGLLGRFVTSSPRDLVLRVHSESWGQMFGDQPSARDIQKFIDPTVKNPLRIYANRHRRYPEYYRAALTSPGLSAGERMRCVGALNAHMAQRVSGFVARRRARS